MQLALKTVGGLILFVVLAVVLVLVGARFSDGPLEIIAGGPFSTGELYEGAEPDWSFLVDRPTVQFQLIDPASSRKIV